MKDVTRSFPVPQGLTSSDAGRRLAEHGPNSVVSQRSRSHALDWAGHALADPMTLLLLVAGPTYLALGDTTSALVAFVAIVPLAATGFVLERRAERALDELARLSAPTARVERDGRWITAPVAEVVPGDLVRLQEGDVVPADGKLVGGTQLTVDESSLTGESRPVDKTPLDPRVLAGTTVLSGRAEIVIEQTGPDTEFGRIGTLLARARPGRTPIERTMRHVVTRLSIVAAGFVIAVGGVELVNGSGWGAALLAGVSLAIATMPEELPIVYTLYLALGARRLAREHVLVRRLAAVETLGATSVICADKTGTLTLGRIAARTLFAASGERWDVGSGEAPGNAIRALLEAAVLASEPAPFDALDRAIVGAARDCGIDVDGLHRRRLVRDYAFDPHAKYMSHVWDGTDGLRIAAKGAVEGILGTGQIEDATRARIMTANAELADAGMRVIAVADGALPATTARDADERSLHLIGLVAFDDPPRPGVADALRQCQDAGVRIVMITGDHPVTAHAIAEGIGLAHEDHSITTGADLDASDLTQRQALVRGTAIFGRTRPEQKHLIVEALRADGEIVAMTGDGINDAPALREADIGVAMGRHGSQVAREAATMVLLDDNFATLVVAVREGRRIFDNLRVAFAYLLAFHVPLVAAAMIIPITGQPLLLLPVSLIMLQLVVHPTAALDFEGDPAAPDVMHRPPRAPGASLIDRRTLARALSVGATLALAVLGLFFGGLDAGMSAGEARTLAFTCLLAGDALLVLIVRAGDEPLWRVSARGNGALLPTVLATVLIAVALVVIPPVRDLLQLSAIEPPAAVLAIILGVLSTTWPAVLAEVRHSSTTS